MFTALLISVLALQTSPQGQDGWAQKLGKERSVFGDIPKSGLWKHGYTGQFGGTYILFRAGTSTERYYYTKSPGADRWRISRVTKQSGKIIKNWMIFIEKGTDERIKKPGPLWLWAGAGRIIGSIPKKALIDLQSQVPLALYHSNVHSSYGSFIFADGKESEPISWEAGFERADNTYSFELLPKTKKPYPITSQERQYLNRESTPLYDR